MRRRLRLALAAPAAILGILAPSNAGSVPSRAPEFNFVIEFLPVDPPSGVDANEFLDAVTLALEKEDRDGTLHFARVPRRRTDACKGRERCDLVSVKELRDAASKRLKIQLIIEPRGRSTHGTKKLPPSLWTCDQDDAPLDEWIDCPTTMAELLLGQLTEHVRDFHDTIATP